MSEIKHDYQIYLAQSHHMHVRNKFLKAFLRTKTYSIKQKWASLRSLLSTLSTATKRWKVQDGCATRLYTSSFSGSVNVFILFRKFLLVTLFRPANEANGTKQWRCILLIKNVISLGRHSTMKHAKLCLDVRATPDLTGDPFRSGTLVAVLLEM